MREQFEEVILEDPTDVASRVAYLDWLNDRPNEQLIRFRGVIDSAPHGTDLTRDGFGAVGQRPRHGEEALSWKEITLYRNRDLFDSLPGDLMALNQCVVWLAGCQKRKTINKQFTSYKLKHLVERYWRSFSGIDSSVQNGIFILAAWTCGFNWSMYGHNPYFNVSSKIGWSVARSAASGSVIIGPKIIERR